jgi:hypothetical protein
LEAVGVQAASRAYGRSGGSIAFGRRFSLPCNVIEKRQEEHRTCAVQEELTPLASPPVSISSGAYLALRGGFSRLHGTLRVANPQEPVLTDVTPVGIEGA